ncbi:MAG: zf-HC2 domain-containing protein [Deltaproteobacteria bacterium]|nr:zf-HC2 domain-containing protein [Deltaproteobacteria bacterium]
MSENCRKHFHRISEYLDGELDERICAEIERHLKDCPKCRDCIDSLRDTIRLCREGSEEEVSDDFRTRLRASLRECMEGR